MVSRAGPPDLPGPPALARTSALQASAFLMFRFAELLVNRPRRACARLGAGFSALQQPTTFSRRSPISLRVTKPLFPKRPEQDRDPSKTRSATTTDQAGRIGLRGKKEECDEVLRRGSAGKSGESSRARTADPHIKSVMLYQLS